MSQSEMAAKLIKVDQQKMWLGQFLHASGSKMFHEYLDIVSITNTERLCLIKSLIKTTNKFFLCNYNMLQWLKYTQFINTFHKDLRLGFSSYCFYWEVVGQSPRPIERRLDWVLYKTDMKIWAVGCGLGWTVLKKVWADYEQLLRVGFSTFCGQKKNLKNCSDRTEKLHWKIVCWVFVIETIAESQIITSGPRISNLVLDIRKAICIWIQKTKSK